MSDVTQILSQIEAGDPSAAQQLLPLVYDELRKLAAARMSQENPGQTLQATALVHDAFLRLVGGEQPQHRIIREIEPLRPSARISTIKDNDLTKIAERSRIESHRLFQHLRSELDWIVMRSLEKDRNRHYGSAAAFAEDIQRFLCDAPVTAGPPSTSYRLKKFIKRNRFALTSWLTSLLALLFVIASIIAYAWNTGEINRQLTSALKRAEESESNMFLASYAENIRLSDDLRQNGNVYLMRDLLLDHRTKFDSKDVRGFEWYYLLAESQREPRKLPAIKDGWAEARFAADGQSLLALGRNLRLNRFDNTTGKLQIEHDLKLGLPYLANSRFSDDGSRLLCMAVDPTAPSTHCEFSLWNTETAECVQKYEERDRFRYPVTCFAPNGTKVGYYSPDQDSGRGEVRIWDSELQPDTPLPNQAVPLNVDQLCFSPDSKLIALAALIKSTSFCVEIRDTVSGQCTSKSIAIDGRASNLCFAPSSQAIAVAVCNAGAPKSSPLPCMMERYASGLVHTISSAFGCLVPNKRKRFVA